MPGQSTDCIVDRWCEKGVFICKMCRNDCLTKRWRQYLQKLNCNALSNTYHRNGMCLQYVDDEQLTIVYILMCVFSSFSRHTWIISPLSMMCASLVFMDFLRVLHMCVGKWGIYVIFSFKFELVITYKISMVLLKAKHYQIRLRYSC